MYNIYMSQEKQEMMKTLSELSGLISNSIEAIDEIVYSFNKVGDEYVAFKLLSVLFETFDFTIQTLYSSRSLFTDDRMESNLNLLIKQLGYMLKCMENEDYILLCDILKSEIIDITKGIKLSIDGVLQ